MLSVFFAWVVFDVIWVGTDLNCKKTDQILYNFPEKYKILIKKLQFILYFVVLLVNNITYKIL